MAQPADSTLAVKILLKDETSVVLQPGQYVEVMEPANFVIGNGTVRSAKDGDEKDFHGRFTGYLVDSGITIRTVFGSSRKWYDFQTPENRYVRLNEGDFLNVDSTQGTGIWYFDSWDAIGKSNERNGRIQYNMIDKIAVEQFSAPKTVGCVIGLVVLLVPLVMLARAIPNGTNWKQ